ncbi:hypothetical protein H310_09124 [Aphanomyces invadans]|uniref:RING-type domain-containing protein n=1 Tax=Aphanomyces invadans TaxID=157072 RepID=A0A024TVX3_9STRA|nr:hypothetical protein H310_09124 [Aphanomyces invadans]ETV97771.1 hypothetical protein H310_09124 [Aphanomyces invadans]|eukprot:XP_008873332.1 hypothetical protein H310_09124 [Aphanomyces invadans]
MGNNSSRGRSSSAGGTSSISCANGPARVSASKIVLLSTAKSSPTYDGDNFTRPTGLYKSCSWEHKAVRRLVLERKIAPRYPGSDAATANSYECPICFLYYPSTLNQSSCCKEAICTECLLQTKPPGKRVCCPFCHSDNFRTNFTVGSTGTLKSILRSDSDCTEVSSPEASILHDDDIEVPFASVADRKKLQDELSAQVGIARASSMPNHRSTTFTAFLSGGDSDVSTSCLEDMMLLEAIRRSMADCAMQPPKRHDQRQTIAHGSRNLTPSAAPSAAS